MNGAALPDGGTMSLVYPDFAGRYVELAVTDTGGGIELDHLTQVFVEPFFTTKDVGKGTGLGLATVHGVVAEPRVRVCGVDAREGEPIHGAVPAAEPPAGAGDSLRPGLRSRVPAAETLFMVEDETVRAVLSRFLTDAGYEVLQARHGREALEVLEERGDPIALVVSDVVMPVMGGKELAARLAATTPTCR